MTDDEANNLEHKLFIAEEWIEGKGDSFAVRSPVDNRTLVEVPIAMTEEVGAAIDAAESAKEKGRLTEA